MAILNPEQLQQISQAIAAVEMKTDAELVAVLAKQSDGYQYIPPLWAALLALMTPLVLLFSPLRLGAGEIYMIQLIVFLLAALLLRIPAVAIRLIPKPVRYWRAANMARRQFLENNLHHTRGDTGVLIFVSEAERYVEIIADRGINQQVAHEKWQQIVNELTSAIKRGDTLNGFLSCINACGALLQEHVPLTVDKDELPNHLVVLE
ncbi:MAG TPA: TPM domain-containing protein [Gammaproteobacteria bacterium]